MHPIHPLPTSLCIIHPTYLYAFVLRCSTRVVRSDKMKGLNFRILKINRIHRDRDSLEATGLSISNNYSSPPRVTVVTHRTGHRSDTRLKTEATRRRQRARQLRSSVGHVATVAVMKDIPNVSELSFVYRFFEVPCHKVA